MLDFPSKQPTTAAGWLALINELVDRDEELAQERAPKDKLIACKHAIDAAQESFIAHECSDLTDALVKLEDVLLSQSEEHLDNRILQSFKKDLLRLLSTTVGEETQDTFLRYDADLRVNFLTHAYAWREWAGQQPVDCWLTFAMSAMARAESCPDLSAEEAAAERARAMAFVALAEEARLAKLRGKLQEPGIAAAALAAAQQAWGRLVETTAALEGAEKRGDPQSEVHELEDADASAAAAAIAAEEALIACRSANLDDIYSKLSYLRQDFGGALECTEERLIRSVLDDIERLSEAEALGAPRKFGPYRPEPFSDEELRRIQAGDEQPHAHLEAAE